MNVSFEIDRCPYGRGRRFLSPSTFFQVITVITEKDEGGILAPAITVFPWRTQTGLKIDLPEDFDLSTGLIDLYEDSQEMGSLEEWIKRSSYNFSEILLDTTLGWIRLESLKDDWLEDVTQSSFGRYYTLEFAKHTQLGPDASQDQLWIHLLNNATYYIEVHDSNFYLGFANPNIPLAYISVMTSEEPSFFYFFETVEVVDLNRPSKPCNPEPEYNFQVRTNHPARARSAWPEGPAR